jgi:hypothetical protein
VQEKRVRIMTVLAASAAAASIASFRRCFRVIGGHDVSAAHRPRNEVEAKPLRKVRNETRVHRIAGNGSPEHQHGARRSSASSSRKGGREDVD